MTAGRLGVLGGAFNPPHIGHLVLAQQAFTQLELSSVVLIPTGQAPHKEIEADPGGDIRLEMTRAAVEGDPRFSVSALEVERDGPSYMYETLEQLADQHPDTEPVLLMGADVAMEFGRWQRPERVLELAGLGVATYNGVADELIEEQVAAAGGQTPTAWISMPSLEISSSMLRKRVRDGEPIRYLVPRAVEELVAAKALYR